MTTITWNPGNDNFLLICNDEPFVPPDKATGIRNAVTGAVITGAVGSTLIDVLPAGTPLGGIVQPVTVVEVSGRPGVYLVNVPSTASLVDGQQLRARTTLEGPAGETYFSEKLIDVEIRD